MVELPENCPKCGAKMKKGTLRAIGSGSSARVSWGPPDWDIDLWGTKEEEVIGVGFTKVDLKGSRCPKCKLMLLYYGEDEEEEEKATRKPQENPEKQI